MKKGLNRDHQQQLQHQQNFNLQTSSFPFNSNYNNQSNSHHSQPRHYLYNNQQIPQVQSQFTSLSLINHSNQNQYQHQQNRSYQQQSRNTSSPRSNNGVIRPSVQSQPERWVPHSIKHVQQKSHGTGEEPNQAIFRKVRGILNKLTPEKFDKLVDGLISLGLNSPSLLKGVILLIFEKALEEPKYSCMYAQLCKILSKELPNFEPPVPVTDPPSSEPPINTFCKLLLIKCKDEFDKRLKATERFNNASTVASSPSSGKNGTASSSGRSDIKLSDEEEEAKTIAKSKMLGNIKFICELGKQGLVHQNILHLCIRQLVGKKREESFESKAQDLECLAQIMTTVGKMLDTEKARKLFDQYFERIEYYSKCPELPARIKFMLKDVMELRQNNWLPRRIQREVAPKTITQIREEAAKEGIIPNFWANNQQFLALMGNASVLNPHVLPAGLFPSPGIAGNVNRPTFSGPLFGHPQGILANQGQRALDDMGYYGHGQGVIHDGRGPMLNPNLQPSHVPYRGSNSQGNERVNRGDNKQRMPQSVNLMTPGNVPPRLRKEGNSMPQINLTKGPAPSPSMKPGNDYFGPAKDSLVLNSYSSSSSPKKDHSARSSPSVTDGFNNKSNQNIPTIDPKQVLLTEVDTMVSQFLEDKISVDDVVVKMKKLKVTKANFSDVTCSIVKKALLESSTDKHRELVTQLLSALHQKDLVVRPGIFIAVVKQLVAQLTELEVNDPLIKTHMAEIISRSVVAEVINMKDAFELVKNVYPMFLLCLQHLKAIQGESWLVDAIEVSKINLMSALPETDQTKESLADILEKRSLEFLQPLLRIESELSKLLHYKPNENGSGDSDGDVTPAILSRWIKDNVDPTLQSNPGFIVILVTCIVKNIMERSKQEATDGKVGCDQINSSPAKSVIDSEREKLDNYKKLLQSLLGSKARLQLAALYALQTVCHDLKFPKGLLVRWFNAFYEMEIVDEEVFFLWKEQVTEEYPGKGQALFQVNAWLTWLEEEAEEEDDEEDEDDENEEDEKVAAVKTKVSSIKASVDSEDQTIVRIIQ